MSKPKVHHDLKIASTGCLVNNWNLETSDPMEEVLQPNYLVQRYAFHGLRKFHRIQVTADILGQGELGSLVVKEVADGRIIVDRTDVP